MSKNLELKTLYEYPEANFNSHFPTGIAFDKFKIRGTNAYKISKWMIGIFSWLMDRLTNHYKGMFITESSFFYEKWKEDYGVPDTTFPLGPTNQIDVYVKKYLMKGNTEWDFRAVCNAYGLACLVRTGRAYLKKYPTLPEATWNDKDPDDVVVVTIFDIGEADFPLKFIHKFGRAENVKKMYDILEKMLSLGTYLIVHSGEDQEELAEAKQDFINIGGQLEGLWGDNNQ